MICQKCGAENYRVVFQALRLPVKLSPRPDSIPKLTTIPKRWACCACGRYHFPDGTLYDFEKAKEMARG